MEDLIHFAAFFRMFRFYPKFKKLFALLPATPGSGWNREL